MSAAKSLWWLFPSDVQRHIMSFVVKKVSKADYLAMKLVCKSWKDLLNQVFVVRMTTITHD